MLARREWVHGALLRAPGAALAGAAAPRASAACPASGGRGQAQDRVPASGHDRRARPPHPRRGGPASAGACAGAAASRPLFRRGRVASSPRARPPTGSAAPAPGAGCGPARGGAWPRGSGRRLGRGLIALAEHPPRARRRVALARGPAARSAGWYGCCARSPHHAAQARLRRRAARRFLLGNGAAEGSSRRRWRPSRAPPSPEPPRPGVRASWWRRVPWWRIAPVLAAAIGRGRLPDPRAALGGPGGPPLPRRPVRPRGLHDLERQLVRRPPHARLQRALPAARPGCSARGCVLDPRGARPPPRCSSRSCAGTSARSARAGARSGSASARPPCCSPAGCRSRSASAFGLASVLALQRGRTQARPAVRRAVRARQPGGGPVPRAGLWPTRSRPRGEGAARAGATGILLAAASLLPPVFLSAAFPEGGYAPFPFSAYVPIPLFALACLDILPRERADAPIGAVLYALGATLALAIETPMGGNASGSARCSAGRCC